MRNYSFDINDPITGFSFLISNIIMLTCFNQIANVFISWGKSYHKQLKYIFNHNFKMLRGISKD